MLDDGVSRGVSTLVLKGGSSSSSLLHRLPSSFLEDTPQRFLLYATFSISILRDLPEPIVVEHWNEVWWVVFRSCQLNREKINHDDWN